MKTFTKPVAIYARVSTTKQNTESQLTALRDYCKNRGWDNVVVFDEKAGLSGMKGESQRPQLAALMKGIRAGKFSALVVWELSRFARSSQHLVDTMKDLKNRNVEFISVNQPIDTTTTLGECFFKIMAAIVEMERQLIIERVVRGQENAQEKGIKLGRKRKVEVDEAAVRHARLNEKKSLRECEKMFGLNKSTIDNICKNPVKLAPAA